MFSRFFSLLPIAALAAVATAVPNTPDTNPATAPKTSDAHPACGAGAAYCCDQKFYDHTDFTGNLGAHLAAAVGATVITCDSITGRTCSVQTACCSNNNVNGAGNVVCDPVAANA